MKEILFMAFFAVIALTASAQNRGKFTVWYGMNVSCIDGEHDFDPDSEFKPLNLGVDYTGAIKNNFFWTAGLSYQTKGAKDWDPGVIQIEGNISYNFLHNSEFKLGCFLGPYMNVMVNKDDKNLDDYADEIETFTAGAQTGLVANYKQLQLKAGIEYSGSDQFKHVNSKPYSYYLRVGFNF